MVTLGFILVRTGVKLYVERQSNREGSRIKTKLVVGALALSFMPAFFLVLFSYLILNVNLQRWLLAPGDAERRVFIEMAHVFKKELAQQADLQAELLARMPETLALVSPGHARRPAFWSASPAAGAGFGRHPARERLAAARFVRSLSHPALQRSRHSFPRTDSGWQIRFWGTP